MDTLGRELDNLTGNLYYRTRWYDPQQGRFFSEDPVGFKAGSNFYGYVRGNPLKWKDPFGTDTWAVGEVGAGAHFIYGINGALGGVVNLKTGERCIFVKGCFRLGPIFSFGAGFKVGAQFLASHCGKDMSGASIELAGEIASPVGGASGNIEYDLSGGAGVGIGVGPEIGVALALALDGCLTKVIKCFNTPCECK
jgi:RHS repeat-associated protein